MTISMKLSDIPRSDLRKGDRFSFMNLYGTIDGVNDDSLVLRWDSAPDVFQVDQYLDEFEYEGSWAMYCIVNEEALAAMNGNRGKLGAQTGHGYQFADWDSQDRFPLHHKHYRKCMSSTKVCLKAANEDILLSVYEKMKPICGVAFIKDEGRTVFSKPTVTVLGIGPIRKDKYGDMRPIEIQRNGIAGSILI